MKQIRDGLRVLLVTLSIPFVLLAADVVNGLIKLMNQGWRYFVPTYSGLADLIQLGSVLAAFAGPIFLPAVTTFWEIGAWFMFWMFIPGILVPYLIEVHGDKQDREKIFEFARLRAYHEE